MSPSLSKSPLTLAELLSALPAGSRILDLGCGGGTFTYSNYPALEIVALDEAVHEKVKDFPPHVRFARGLASAIPAPGGSFDAVVANFAFEHFPDAAAALGEIERVLADGARAWISIPNAGSFEDQLYRNLYAGGGHLQHPSFEWFLRQVYSGTSLRLISFVELPAGFTYLGTSEELRHLTWAIVDALRRTVGLDARTRSGYIFVLQKLASAGPGFVEPPALLLLVRDPRRRDLRRRFGPAGRRALDLRLLRRRQQLSCGDTDRPPRRGRALDAPGMGALPGNPSRAPA